MALNISGINYSYQNAYPATSQAVQTPAGRPADSETLWHSGAKGIKDANMTGLYGIEESKEKERYGIKDPGEECETCKNRKYQDGSDEHNVSFKTAAHVSPNAAGPAVRAHENQHVSNAYKKAAQDNGKVLNASVSIHTSICPECGRSYVSGGTTRTQIKYYNEENPYQQDLKATDGVKYRGMNVNLTA